MDTTSMINNAETTVQPLPVRFILLGTAGHIDHGKTRLVGRLTGVNTDRLPEEKSRGISIDLGFAQIDAGDVRVGVVDVPGHEKFVRNMVAGATGINVALLVVAADDGVMPQTREHLEIMNLLGIPAGLIALTKTDIVDEEMIELVRCDIEDSVQGTFLEGAPIVPVSSETGAGLDDLRDELLRLCREVELPESLPVFRMAIDRVFSISGHGTVVTGSVLSGDVHVGDTLDLWPDGREVRVRGVERHGEQTAEAGSRQRTAINLAGVKHDEVIRGCELATRGYLAPTHRLLVDLRVVSSSPTALKDRMTASLHLGTREVPVRVVLKGRRLEPGERGFAELRLDEPVVAAWGQRFILRRTSPAVTIGGGMVLDPAIPEMRRIRDIEQLGEQLSSRSATDRLAVRLCQQDSLSATDLTLASSVGLMPDQLQEQLALLRSRGEIVSLGSAERPLEIHQRRLAALSASILRTIREEVLKHQPRRSLPRPTLQMACREISSAAIIEAVIEQLIRAGDLVRIGRNLGPSDLQVQLTKQQRKTRDAILERIQVAHLTPPTLKELTDETGRPAAEIQQLLDLTTEDGLTIRTSDGLYFTPSAIEAARQQAVSHIREHGPSSMADLRDAWGVTRKFSVPLCELLDELGITKRDGDLRDAGPHADVPIADLAQ